MTMSFFRCTVILGRNRAAGILVPKRGFAIRPIVGLNTNLFALTTARRRLAISSKVRQRRLMSRRYTEGHDGAFTEIHATTTRFETNLRNNMSPNNPNRGFLLLLGVPLMLLMLSDPILLLSVTACGFGFRYFNQIPKSQLQEWDRRYLEQFGEYYALVVLGLPLGAVFMIFPPMGFIFGSILLTIWINRGSGVLNSSNYQPSQSYTDKVQNLDQRVSSFFDNLKKNADQFFGNKKQ